TRGVSYVRLGDAVWGLPAAAGAYPGMATATTYLMAFDTTMSEADALASMESKTRAHIRKAEREGVRVEQIADERGIEEFCGLLDETAERMRARHVAAAVPAAYFRAVFREMVPRGEAIFLLARIDACALAGALFLVSRERMSYFHGVSTR